MPTDNPLLPAEPEPLAPAAPACVAVQARFADRITLRRTSNVAGYAEVQLDDALLRLRVVADPAGKLHAFVPEAIDTHGRSTPAFVLRRGLQKATAAALTAMWPTAAIVPEDDR
jgi:hypothetical protein